MLSNKIVGYSIDSRMTSSLAVNALNNAVAIRGNVAGCVIHSDRGSQFRSRKFLRALARHQMVGSMGWVASCGDNTATASFFSLLQKNVLDRSFWTTQEELRIAIVTWIERTYHRRRRQARLGRLTRVESEAIMNTPAALAAWLGPVTYSCSRPACWQDLKLRPFESFLNQSGIGGRRFDVRNRLLCSVACTKLSTPRPA
jgi:putative transposase